MRTNRPIISKSLLCGVLVGSVVLAVAYLILVMMHREYDAGLPIDDGLFGTYGDFIGGVIGTIVAFYSAFLLVRTLENQVETNDSVIKANNAAITASQIEGYLSQIERFDGMFNSFLSSYFKVIDSYSIQKEKEIIYGRNAFEEIVSRFIETDFSNNLEFQRRHYAAVEEYADFYAKERTHLSVHMRLLYLTISLISESELEETDKVKYAKLIRGQMSDAEMVIVRYNCCSEYGKKMQDYCNAFNLTKHVPIMHLLEFRKYYNHIKQWVDDYQKDNFAELIGGLEAMFIELRKKGTKMLYSVGPAYDRFETNKRYAIDMATNTGHRNFEIAFKKDKQVNRVGGGYRLKASEKALDVFEDELLQNLFYDCAYEMFIASNFGRYNSGVKIKKTTLKSDTQSYSFVIKLQNTKALALSQIQVNKREHSVIEEI